MSLLPFTLTLLLSLGLTLGAPTAPPNAAPQTSIETICETKTVVHEVTTTKKPCSCPDEEEGSGTMEEETTTTTTTTPAPRTTIETIVETVTRTVIHDVTEPTVAKKPCSCNTAVEEVEDYPASASDVEEAVEVVEHVRVCTCDEKDACRKESTDSMDACMEECDEHLEGYGDKTEAYRGCFSSNNASIVEAEKCFFDGLKCTDNGKIVEATKWDSFADIEYQPNADKTIKENYLWKRDETKYNTIQTFFHCTKHCMHKKVQECSSTKQCTIQVPDRDEFATKMGECTKKNSKITQAIFASCQCLAWKNGVKDLQGSCVVIGNQFYIDRA